MPTLTDQQYLAIVDRYQRIILGEGGLRDTLMFQDLPLLLADYRATELDDAPQALPRTHIRDSSAVTPGLDDPWRFARGVALGMALGVLLWTAIALLVFWLLGGGPWRLG